MKKLLLGSLGILLVLVNIACNGSANKAPPDGTYIFDPRPQATQTGNPVSAYLDRVTISDGYATFYLTSVPDGDSNMHDIPEPWGLGSSHGSVALQNLDKKDLSYTDVASKGLTNRSGQWVAFDHIVGSRFTLSYRGQAPIIFKEIVLRKPTKEYAPVDTFIFAQSNFDPKKNAYTEVTFSDLMEHIETGNVDGLFISDVVCAGWTGSKIVFKSADDRYIKEFQIGSAPPEGLSVGQEVKIYYLARFTRTSYGYTEGWYIYAIDRLDEVEE